MDVSRSTRKSPCIPSPLPPSLWTMATVMGGGSGDGRASAEHTAEVGPDEPEGGEVLVFGNHEMESKGGIMTPSLTGDAGSDGTGGTGGGKEGEGSPGVGVKPASVGETALAVGANVGGAVDDIVTSRTFFLALLS